MRNQKICTINGKDFVIKEITVRDIVEEGDSLIKFFDNFSFEKLLTLSQSVLSRFSTIKKEDLLEFTFSEIDEIELVFREVNKSFLKRLSQGALLVNRLGVHEYLDKILASIREDILKKISV